MRTVESTPRRHRDHPVRGEVTGAADSSPAGRWQRVVQGGWRRRSVRRHAPADADTPRGLIEQVLTSGHRRLVFPRPLEQTFQYDIASARRRLMLMCALIGIASFWFLSAFDDQMLADLGSLQQRGRITLVVLMTLSLAVVFCIPERWRRNWHHEALTFFNTLALNAALVRAGALSSDLLVLTHTQAVVLVLMYAALVARQRFWWSLSSVVVTFVSYLVFVRGQEPLLQQIVDQNVKFILVAFAFTLSSNYLFEHGERRAWLLRQLDIHKRAALVDTRDRLRLLSHCDALTGLFNRRRFLGDLDAAWCTGQAEGHSVSALMLDVDHFKLYNDSHGHPAGDACLVRIAELLQQQVSPEDGVVARLGGEEFAVLLPRSTEAQAREVAERLCRAVQHAGIEHRASPVAPVVTVSIGLAVSQPAGQDGSPAGLLAAADKALYLAKAAGRNGVQRASADWVAQRSAEQAFPGADLEGPPVAGALPMTSSPQVTADDLEAVLNQGRGTRRFPPFIEAAYEHKRAGARRRHLFIMSWLGLFCINAYTFHSRAMLPDVPEHLLFTFLAICGGLGLLTPLLLCPLQGWLRELLYTEGICAASVAAVYVLSHSAQTTTFSFMTALFFLPLFTGVVGRQTVWHTAVTSALTLGAVMYFMRPVDVQQALVLRDSLIIVAMACIYTMIAGHNLDRGSRKQWLLRELERLRQIELEEASRALHELSMKDPLTGLPNRRRFEADCARAWTQASQDDKTAVALLLIDIDHFKRFNDGYGHPAGDRCLQDVAQILAQVAEQADGVAVRLGGEEFAILLPQVWPARALDIAEQVCIAVRANNIEHLYSLTDSRLTVSVGLAMSDANRHSTACLLGAADQALYQAKRAGRDGLVLFQPDEAQEPPAPADTPTGTLAWVRRAAG